MTRWLGVAIVLWGAPLAVMGLLPYDAVALLAAGVIGIGNALVDVTAFTLIARMVPNDVLARVFGVLESVGALAVALGSLVAPLLIASSGVQGALIAVGAVAPVPVCSGGAGSPRSTGPSPCGPTTSSCSVRCRCCARCRCRSSRTWPRASAAGAGGR